SATPFPYTTLFRSNEFSHSLIHRTQIPLFGLVVISRWAARDSMAGEKAGSKIQRLPFRPIPPNSPVSSRNPLGSAEKLLMLLAPRLGETHNPAPSVVVPVDFSIPPAMSSKWLASASRCIFNVLKSVESGIRQPSGHKPRGS